MKYLPFVLYAIGSACFLAGSILSLMIMDDPP
jgi:hypothetical protein